MGKWIKKFEAQIFQFVKVEGINENKFGKIQNIRINYTNAERGSWIVLFDGNWVMQEVNGSSGWNAG